MQQTFHSSDSIQLDNWIKEHSKRLLNRAFYMLGDKEDAKDVVQEVFLSAYKNQASYEARSSPQTWLMAILHHKIADIYKKRYHDGIISLNFDHLFDKHGEWNESGVLRPWDQDENSTSSLLDNEHFNLTFQKCIDALPKQWYMVVKLCYIEGWKAKEICRELNISTTNYWKLLQRSRLQLRECIEIKWFSK